MMPIGESHITNSVLCLESQLSDNLSKIVSADYISQISFVLVGVGVGISNIILKPGCSKNLYGIKMPYAVEATRHILNTGKEANSEVIDVAVTEKTAIALCEAEFAAANNIVVSCTGAISTSRYRKGKNHAWIAVCSNGMKPKAFYLELNKPSFEEYHTYTIEEIFLLRKKEDLEISVKITELLLSLKELFL